MTRRPWRRKLRATSSYPSPRLRVAVLDGEGSTEHVYLNLTLADLEAWLRFKDPMRTSHRHELLRYFLPLQAGQNASTDHNRSMLVSLEHQ